MQTFVHATPKPIDVAKYDPFLAACPVIDCEHPAIQNRAQLLSNGFDNDFDITKACYEWVRDEIQHSSDFERGPVTCKASDVLEHGTGFCFAKSHLLAALLRANGVPTGLSYQRLRSGHKAYVLHGLNVVHLPRIGWYRLDARGNKPGVEAQFTPPKERLAWSGQGIGEINFEKVWATPMTTIVTFLQGCATWQEVMDNLPDMVDM